MTTSGDRTPLLELRDVVVHYGRIEALHGVSLVVREGELVTLLGSNGAGKTTTMRAISGLRPLSRGSVWFEGRDISRVKAHKRVADGLIQAPEGRGVFPGMTVTENLEMGCYGRPFPSRVERREKLDWVFEVFPRLAERRNQVGGTLSGGEQQMLAIGRALMARPRLLLLDEPSMGLAPMVIQQIFRIISEINSQGTTVLLVEQNAQQALSRSDRAYILERAPSPTKARRGSFSTTRASAPLTLASLDRDDTTEELDASLGRSGFRRPHRRGGRRYRARFWLPPRRSCSDRSARQADSGEHRPGGRPCRQRQRVCPPLSIAMAGALTGPDPEASVNIKDGVQLAIEKHNTANAGAKFRSKSSTPVVIRRGSTTSRYRSSLTCTRSG